MKIKNFVGYMLGNSGHVVAPGEQWSQYQTPVWVCRNLDVARNVLRSSHKNSSMLSTVWTTIYRVHGTNIECDRMDSQFYYTSRPDKIIAGPAVHYQEPPQITEAQLLANARRIRDSLTRVMNAAFEMRTFGD